MNTETSPILDGTPAVDAASEGNKYVHMLLAMSTVTKNLVAGIGMLRVHFNHPGFKKHIDAIAKSQRVLLADIQAFKRFHVQNSNATPAQVANGKAVEEVTELVSLLPYRTPLEKFDELHNHVRNFDTNQYIVVDDSILAAFTSAPTDFSAGMYELVNRCFPESSDSAKKAFAINVEKLIHARHELGVRV